MTRVVATAQAVKILTIIAFFAALALCVVSASTVPDWCEATQQTADEQCAVMTGR